MKKFSFLTLFMILDVLLVQSCKPTVPGEYIQPNEMEDILYDYHVAQAMADEADQNEQGYNYKLYRLGVLKKYGVTEAEFDSSLVYYTRHADRLRKIYENLSTRLENEAVALGATVSDLNKFGTDGVIGDTANIWPVERSIVFMPNAPYNVVSYKVDADTAFHKGDRFILSFDSQFIFQDGSKDGIAMLALRFNNDSVASRIAHVTSNSRYSLELQDKDKLGIKSVSGFIYLSDDANSSATTLKLLFVNNIQLVRFHDKCTVKNAANASEKDAGKQDDDMKSDSLTIVSSNGPSFSSGSANKLQSNPQSVTNKVAPVRELRSSDKPEQDKN